MPYEFIDKNGRVIKAPTEVERNEMLTRANEAINNRRLRKLKEQEQANKVNDLYDEYGQTPEQAAKRDYYVNLIQGHLNDMADVSKYSDLASGYETEAWGGQQEKAYKARLYGNIASSILGLTSAATGIGAILDRSRYMLPNTVFNGVSAIVDGTQGDYGQLATDLIGLGAPLLNKTNFLFPIHRKMIDGITGKPVRQLFIANGEKIGEGISVGGDLYGVGKNAFNIVDKLKNR
ncbi:MAG: hypothetical protein KNU04_gp40 [crAssphage sp. isolate ctbg_1]|uniref:Uncharacterized protein n=1 Tax=crAssphage sp. isolate ctbg_1 TaxID=2989854 RepID=A0A345MT04_9CAUD|nr:MAG: hypothetical protein KNU04_gp40 [crAssphage sp. isolate ctbg_1]AXH74504.1 MAG: hypothetical protein [crAssphage sp. isolate ctbg_1]